MEITRGGLPSNALAASSKEDHSRLEAVSGRGNIGLLRAWLLLANRLRLLGISCVTRGDNLKTVLVYLR